MTQHYEKADLRDLRYSLVVAGCSQVDDTLSLGRRNETVLYRNDFPDILSVDLHAHCLLSLHLCSMMEDEQIKLNLETFCFYWLDRAILNFSAADFGLKYFHSISTTPSNTFKVVKF